MPRISLHLLSESEHRFEGFDTELASRQRQIAFGVRRVEADGNGIKDAAREVRRRVAAVDEIREAVRIDARRQVGMLLLDEAQQFDEVGKPHRRLAEAAEDNFPHIVPRRGEESRLDLLDRRLFAAEPQAHVLGHILHRAQAEGARTRTFIRDIDVEAALPFGAALEAFFGQEVLAAIDHVDKHRYFPFQKCG